MRLTENENIHRGHRRRMRERFQREGIDSFELHEILEILMYYAIPQKDTNRLGHNLANRFGSLHAVFIASPEALREVEGITEALKTISVNLLDQVVVGRDGAYSMRGNGTLLESSF